MTPSDDSIMSMMGDPGTPEKQSAPAPCSALDIEELERLLGAMKPGPYEYWDQPGNDLLAAECKNGNGRLIAALPGITSMRNEFMAIAAILNAAPALIAAYKQNAKLCEPPEETSR